MAIDDGLRGGPIVVETGRRHGLLDVADGVLALGDPGLEIVDSCAARLGSALLAAGFGISAFLVFARFARRLGRRLPFALCILDFLTLNSALCTLNFLL